MAAKAARPAMAIELPTVLAAPVNGVIGELVGLGTALKNMLVTELVARRGREAYPVPEGAKPDEAGEPAAGDPATGEPAAGDPAAGTVGALAPD